MEVLAARRESWQVPAIGRLADDGARKAMRRSCEPVNSKCLLRLAERCESVRLDAVLQLL